MFPFERTIVPHVIQEEQTLAVLNERSTAREAAKLMSERHIGAVLIVERGRLAGIFSERDLTSRVVAPALDPDKATMAKVMTRNPETIRPTDTVRSALMLMHQRSFRHLPVVEGTKVIGIVSIRDLQRTVMDQIEADILTVAEHLIKS